jgi:Ca-activated chloride channel family protein
MNFKSPEYLLLIPLLFLLVYLKKKQKPPVITYSMASYLKAVVRENKFRKNIFLILRTAAICLLIIALARPREGLKERNIVKPAVDIMLVMDVSTSMKAIDLKPLDRMNAAKSAAKEFISSRTSDRLGMVVFSGLPLLQCPLTLDNNAVLRLTDRIEAGMIDVGGTGVGLGLALGLKYLEKSDSPSKIVVLLTDGANNTGDIDPMTAADMAKALGIKVYTIGCGKPGPAQVPIDHPHFGMRLVTIPDELDEDTLTSMAENTGGKYFRATSFKKLKDVYAEIDRMEKRNVEVTEYYEFQEKYMIYLFLGALLILIEIIIRLLFPGMVL